MEKNHFFRIFAFLSHSMGNGAVQNKPHNKRLIHKYLEKLFDTTFKKYLNLNPDHKYVRPCCHSQGSGRI